MISLTERMNVSRKSVAGAHVMHNVHLGLAAYDTMCLICAELNVDLKNVSDVDFNSCVDTLDNFANAANEDSGYTISVWFD